MCSFFAEHFQVFLACVCVWLYILLQIIKSPLIISPQQCVDAELIPHKYIMYRTHTHMHRVGTIKLDNCLIIVRLTYHPFFSELLYDNNCVCVRICHLTNSRDPIEGRFCTRKLIFVCVKEMCTHTE